MQQLHRDGLRTSGPYTSSRCCWGSPPRFSAAAVMDAAGVPECKKEPVLQRVGWLTSLMLLDPDGDDVGLPV